MYLKLSIKFYNIDLASNIKVGSYNLKNRSGYYIKSEYNSTSGMGELSPLPGLHTVDLEESLKVTTKIMNHINNQKIIINKNTLHNFKLDKLLFNLVDIKKIKYNNKVSTFAIESSLLDLLINLSSDIVLSKLKITSNKILVSCNALLAPNLTSNEFNISQIVKSNFKSIKVKIGRLPLELEARVINNLIDSMGPHVMLKLDGNRSMTEYDLRQLLNKIDTTKIDYLEEPLIDIFKWPKIYQKFNIGLAIDESFRDYEKSLNFPIGTKSIIIKPTLFNGISETISIIDKLNSNNISTVISSSYNSCVGIKMLAIIANYQNKIRSESFAGLDTLKYFFSESLKNEPYHENLYLNEGKLVVNL